ncbi:unnamed protein product [Cuscuta campestris]|uniref:VWFA domain-containing protein n=1 Tax=Cuscuta campestris TaxID=132261 RepID=A0A484KXA0_9ASTE|nr:unnamed protein product [Cuscuta campestris]
MQASMMKILVYEEDEPIDFSDDDPLHIILSTTLDDPSSSGDGPQHKVCIKSVPERVAIAASESIPEFSVLVGIRAPSLPDGRSQRAPVDLVMVLDVSGSMSGQKLALVKQAVHFVVDNLGPSDRLSIVSFATHAKRVLRLTLMTEHGRDEARCAVNSLLTKDTTNIVAGLKTAVKVLEERRHRNPMATILFLSDGNDNCNGGSSFQSRGSRKAPDYLHLLLASICPRNQKTMGEEDDVVKETFPVHAFGFGSDHDPVAMHAIGEASDGTFSFIESYRVVQDAFASCIGGVLSVVVQDLCLMVRSASHGVEIKSIPSGRYRSEISDQGSQGLLHIGDLYADEAKEFFVNVSVPVSSLSSSNDSIERKTTLLDIKCSYKDVSALSKNTMQRNRLRVIEGITQAQKMAESGDLTGAQELLQAKREELLGSASCHANDNLSMCLVAEIEETRKWMENMHVYCSSGRAYALAGMSSHAMQRATTQGGQVPGTQLATGCARRRSSSRKVCGGAFYATPNMAKMVEKSKKVTKKRTREGEES